MKVGIINYGVGNLGSVLRALEELKVTPLLIDRAIDLHAADCFVLPGVGNFSDCAELLRQGQWDVALQEEVLAYAKPLLGVCVGMQLLASSSEEGSHDHSLPCRGLDLIPGSVKHLKNLGCKSRTPHVGWNSVSSIGKPSLFFEIPEETDFYFVHSYAFVTDDPLHTIAYTDYDIKVTAAVQKGSIWGTQFHPEKSSRAGFQLLRNFIERRIC